LAYVKKNFPAVKIISNKSNLGFGRGMNLGVRKSKGKYILLINNDAWVKKDFLDKLLRYYQKNKIDLIAPKEKRYDGGGNFTINTTIDPTGSPAFYKPSYSKTKKQFFLSGVCLFCDRNLFEATGGFDEDYFMYNEDVDWSWRLRLLGKKLAYAKGIYVYHAGAGSTGPGIKYKIFLWRNQNTLQTLIKNYKALTLFFIIPLYILQNIGEIIFFLLTFKPKIALSYIEGWTYNIRYIGRTLRKRKQIQKNRVIGDWEVIRHMYPGPAKIKMLFNYK
jgi:GT2 family glycosyltransferase